MIGEDENRFKLSEIESMSDRDIVYCYLLGFEVAEFPIDIALKEILRRGGFEKVNSFRRSQNESRGN